MGKIQDFVVYENEAILGGKPKRLRWNNEAIAQAILYLDEEKTDIEILQAIANGNIRGLRALLFGARKAANRHYTKSRFDKEFDREEITRYIEAVTDGIQHYLPQVGLTPAPQDEAGKKGSDSFIDGFAEIAVRTLGVTCQQLAEMSPRNISAMFEIKYREAITKDEYYGDEIPWL